MPIDTIATWHQLVKGLDVKGLDLLLAEDAVFYSPVVHTPQVGKAVTKAYLAAAFAVFYNDSFATCASLRVRVMPCWSLK